MSRTPKKPESGLAKTEAATATQTLAQQILGQVQSANVDSQASAQFTGLNLISQARTNQLQRQATTLTAQFGASDSRVVALQNSIQSEQSRALKLGAVRDEAATPAPPVPTGGWVLHGRVRDQNLQPVAKVSVLLLNEQKEWLRSYGYAFTDATGYFLLSYSPARSAKGTASVSVSAYLEVLDQNQQPLYIDSSAFSLSKGATLYRDIVLPSLSPLGVPPSGTVSVSPPSC
jgi:hypothetical protein